MAQRAGRVGVNPADVNPVTGHVNVQVPGNVYTKTQVDNKFLTKTKAASDYQTKNLDVPIQLLDGSALTVEAALQGLNSQKQDKQLAVPISLLDGSALTVENALQGINGATIPDGDVFTITINETDVDFYFTKVGNIVVVSVFDNNAITVGNAWITVADPLPVKYRPVSGQRFCNFPVSISGFLRMSISYEGTVRISSSSTGSLYLQGTGIYALNL